MTSPLLARSVSLALLAALAAAPASARIGGIVGYSDIGCVDCHDAGAPAPSIEIVGPTAVAPGTEVAYQVVITSMAPSQLGAGFNFAAEAGDVLVGGDDGVRRAENREMRRFELTHTGPRENDGNRQAAWSVVWQTPTAPGDYVLFAAGNSVNLDSEQIGDSSSFTILTVRVGDAAATPTPTATPAPACAGDCNGDGSVAINELISGVNIALGSAAVDACRAMDGNGDGTVAINEVVGAVSRALSGC